MKVGLSVLSAVFFALFVVSCSSTHRTSPSASAPASAPFSLTASEWMLADLAGSPVVPDSKASLAFPEAGKVAGNASCNRFTGTATISSDTLKFSHLARTMMACPDQNVGAQETTYLKALNAASRFAWQNPFLLIYCEGFDKPLRFTRALAPTH